MAFVAAILSEPSPSIGIAIGVLLVAGFVERARYLSKLPKMALERTGDSHTGHAAPQDTVQLTSRDIDRAYVAERSVFDGLLLVACGGLMTAGISYVLFTSSDVPLVFTLPLTAAGVIITYAGIRILLVKKGGTGRKRRRKRKDAT